MIRRLLIGALIALTVALAACGGSNDPPLLLAQTGEVRIAVRINSQAEIAVALLSRDSEGNWTAIAHPHDAIVAESQGDDDWWRSSPILARTDSPTVVRIDDGVFTFDPSVAGYADDCGLVSIAPRQRGAALWVSAPTGSACDQWLEPIKLTSLPGSVELTTRIAARWLGDCIDVRVEVRGRPGNWRALPESHLCGLATQRRLAALDGEGLVQQESSVTILPVSEESSAIEVRVGGGFGMTASIAGRILSADCGILLRRGFRSVWLHNYDVNCDQNQVVFVLELDDGPAPEDSLDEQQYEVYDWEYHVTSNMRSLTWKLPITFERAQAIVDAIYADFYGSPAGAPQVTVAPNEQEHAGQYNPSRHAIQLTRRGLFPGIVVHETAHAMLRLSVGAANAYYLEARHGPLFAALMIALWTRYADGFDPEAARALAAAYKVQLDDLVPIAPIGDEQTRQAVTDALGLNDPDRQTE